MGNMSIDEKGIVELYASAATEFFAQTHTALERMDADIIKKTWGILKGAQFAAGRAVEMRLNSEYIQGTATWSALAAWASENRYKKIANGSEINNFNEAKLNAVTSSIAEADPNDPEAMLRAQLLKDQFEADSEFTMKQAEHFENYIDGDLKKICFSKPPSQGELGDISHHVFFALTIAAQAKFDAELAQAISFRADKLAELHALAAWNARGVRGLQKAAESGAIPVNSELEPRALVILRDEENKRLEKVRIHTDFNYYKYWEQFAIASGLDRSISDEIVNSCHEWLMGRLLDSHGRNQDFKEYFFSVLIREISKKHGKSTEETENEFHQLLLRN